MIEPLLLYAFFGKKLVVILSSPTTYIYSGFFFIEMGLYSSVLILVRVGWGGGYL